MRIERAPEAANEAASWIECSVTVYVTDPAGELPLEAFALICRTGRAGGTTRPSLKIFTEFWRIGIAGKL
jgi:hypothetical protein